MNRGLRRSLGAVATTCALLVTAPASAGTGSPDEITDATTGPLVVIVDPLAQIRLPGRAHPNDVWVSNIGRADLTDVTVTVDASALEGVSDDVEVPCDPDGDLIGVCEDLGPVRRGVPVGVGQVRVGPAKASAADTTRQVRVTATAGDGSRGMQRFPVHVMGTGPAFDRAPAARERLDPGGTLPLPGGFTNYSRSRLEAVEVSLTLSPGLSLTERFRNCLWRTPDEEGADRTVRCKVVGPFAPMASYDVDLGAVRAADDATRERITYGVRSMEAGAPLAPLGLDDERRGDGPTELTAVARTGATTSLRADASEYELASTIDVANTADFAVDGATLRGRPGDVVRGEFAVRNAGPGSRGATREEEEARIQNAVWLSVPPGVTVVKAPPNCVGYKKNRRGTDPGTWLGLGKPKGRAYGCGGGAYLEAGKELRFAFEFRIDSREPGPGSVTTMFRAGDPRPGDNTARVEVEVP